MSVFPEDPIAPPPSKYQGERHDKRHPGNVHWPGANGLPFLGTTAPPLRPAELANLPIVGYAYVKTFNLDDPKDLEYYTWVRDHAGHRLFSIDYESHHPVEWRDADNVPRIRMYVHLEWRQLYSTLPSSNQRGPGHNADATHFTLR